MKTLVTGAGGQLGRELVKVCPSHVEILALERSQLDITQRQEVAAKFNALQPRAVINAAAYTAVDRAEEEKERALAVNADGARNVALAAAAISARLIQISTDFVFDGTRGRPYSTDAPPSPMSAYGTSKWLGERHVTEVLGDAALILRTAWLYSRFGTNFVTSMLRLMRERDEIVVVTDQVGTPTWARGLAQALWAAVDRPALAGIHHWTDAGVASWYDLAVAVQEEASQLGLLRTPCAVRPIATADFPTAARRPPFSVLDKSVTWKSLGAVAPHWRRQLRLMLQELVENRHD